MAINESVIRRIIREEARRLFSEGDDLPGPHFPPGSVRRPGLGAFGRFEPPEGEWEPDPFDDEDDEEETSDEKDLDEARKRGKSVVKKGDKKASAGSVAIFKKAASKKKGGETKKKRAGFDAVKKSAEKWADNPAAAAQAATMVATGEPVVAKGEKRQRK